MAGSRFGGVDLDAGHEQRSAVPHSRFTDVILRVDGHAVL